MEPTFIVTAFGMLIDLGMYESMNAEAPHPASCFMSVAAPKNARRFRFAERARPVSRQIADTRNAA
jgi:hypothetical protein